MERPPEDQAFDISLYKVQPRRRGAQLFFPGREAEGAANPLPGGEWFFCFLPAARPSDARYGLLLQGKRASCDSPENSKEFAWEQVD
jgi:hypothetical protein